MINTNPPIHAHPAPPLGRRASRHARYGALAAYASVAAAAALGLSLALLAKPLVASGLPPLEIIFWRLLFAGGLFALHTLAARRLPNLAAADMARVAGLALLGFVPLYTAFVAAPPSYLLPALLGLALYVSLGSASPLRKLNLLLAATLGLLLLSSLQGDALLLQPPLLLGVGAAGAIVFSRSLIGRYSPTSFLALAFPLVALALLPLLPLSPQDPWHYLQLGLFAVLSSYAIYGLYYLVLDHLGVRREVLWATAEPVAALLVVLLLFTPAWPLLALAGLMMAALLIIARGVRL